jgi:hypothetical protein
MLWCSELIKHSLISYIKIFNKAGRHILPEPCSHLIKILSVFHAKILHGIQDIKIYCVLWILQTCSIQDQDFIPWQRGSTLNSRSQPPKSVLSFPNMDFYPLTSVPKPFKSFFSFRNRGFLSPPDLHFQPHILHLFLSVQYTFVCSNIWASTVVTNAAVAQMSCSTKPMKQPRQTSLSLTSVAKMSVTQSLPFLLNSRYLTT